MRDAKIKLPIVCIVAVCFMVTGLYADEPQQSTTTSTPPSEIMMRDAARRYMLMAPPVSPVIISGTPDYLWRHGCGPTAVGNVVGYYDSHGYDDLITGDANTQTNNVDQAIASGGTTGSPNPPGSEQHYEDYACPEDPPPGPLKTDDYITKARIPHPNDCIGDYMDTSKSTRANKYGWSWSSDVGPSFVDYINQQNASYNPTYKEYSPVTGNPLTWAVMTNEINNNRPMIFLVDSDGDGSTDHMVTVVGYDVNTNQYGCLDTWVPAGVIRWETFQSIGNGAWSIWGGWTLWLGQQGGGEVTKWEQLPNITPYGMDVRCDRRDDANRVLADDFLCTQTGPITKVRIWGSWKNDMKGQIKTIHLSIHSDDPVGPGGTDPENIYSKPDFLLWSGDFNEPNFTETLFYDLGDDYEWWWQPGTPPIPAGDHKIWVYDIAIDPCQAFIQDGDPCYPIVYWLDAYVILGPNVPSSQFGWKTSMEHWNDDAVWDSNGWMEMRYPPTHPLHPDSVDLAFAIITGQTTEPNEEPNNYPTDAKWLQRPDLSENGLDVMASVPLILADDFECNKSTLITDITIWGSWLKDILPPGGPFNVTFNLSIHSDIPASQSPTGHSMPNELLWHMTLPPSEVSIERQDINEGWFDPVMPIYDPNGDHVCWKYVFHIPEQEAFCQRGEPNSPLVYWLNVQADLGDLNEPNKMPFGWKTSTDHWNDDAVWTVDINDLDPNTIWWELRYPSGHPYYPNSIDLAFAIEGNIPCSVPEHELGDAPDSSNSFGVGMTAYPGVAANYPTVYVAGSPPFGPIHWQPLAVAWLGPNVSLENEADIGPDQDGINNINPPANSSDHDASDDSVLNMPLILPHCRLTTFQYQVNVVNPNVDLYVNVWFDWNRDGDWNDTLSCGDPNLAPEWAVQNQVLPAGSLPVGLDTITTPQFKSWHPNYPNTPPDVNTWMRITLSEQPWVDTGSGGSGPANGYYFGETEDYYFSPITECYKSTDPNYALTWVPLGRPDCWCFRKQCRGDADGKTGMGNKRVTGTDLNMFKVGFNKTVAQLQALADANGVCGDFNHRQGMGQKPVGGADLNVWKIYFNQVDVIVPECNSTHINFWTN